MIRPEKKWTLGDNSQKQNVLIGLEECSGDKICIVEDDDYYAPNYLETLVAELTNPRYELQVVGELNSRYYNLKHRRYRLLKNSSFSPLCQTIFRRSVISTVQKVLAERETKFDVYFWKELTVPRFLFPTTTLTVGMKGMPGRPGLGIGHNAEDPSWKQDTENLDHLFKWIGNDALKYLELYRGKSC